MLPSQPVIVEASPAENEETTQERVFFHEDDSFHQRTDWFLVGHAILLEAFFSTGDALSALVVATLGIFTAWGWLSVSTRQMRNLDVLKTELRKVSPFYQRMQEERADKDRTQHGFFRQRASRLFGRWLPGAFLVAWALLLVVRLLHVYEHGCLGRVGG